MTLTEKKLRELEGISFIYFTKEQRQIILDCFRTEPEPYVWTEQDIAEQIRRICSEYPAVRTQVPLWA